MENRPLRKSTTKDFQLGRYWLNCKITAYYRTTAPQMAHALRERGPAVSYHFFRVNLAGHAGCKSPTPQAEPFFGSSQSLISSQDSPPFMELDDLSPCSQHPATWPHPEPHEFSPLHHTSFIKPVLILVYHLRFGPASGLFPSRYTRFSPPTPPRSICSGHLVLLEFNLMIYTIKNTQQIKTLIIKFLQRIKLANIFSW